MPQPVPVPVPQGVPVEVPAQPPAPVEHVLPPSDWNPPSWQVPSVDEALEVIQAVGVGAGMALIAGAALVKYARRRGLEASEVGRYAAGAAVMPVGAIVIDHSWTAPLELLVEGAQAAQLGGGYLAGAMAAVAITAFPAGWTAAALWWARTREREQDGMGASPKKSVRMRRRHAAAKARAGRAAARSAVPFTAGWPVPTEVVLGVCSRRVTPTPETALSALFSRENKQLSVPIAALDEHLFVLGDSGSGKTTTLSRLMVGMFMADWERYLSGGPRPLLVFLDGGGDINTGRRFVETMARIGVQPDRILLWPDSGALNLWAMSAEEITETLQKMVCPTAPTDSAQEYFFKSRRRVIRLAMGTCEHAGPAVTPPKSRRQLFARLDAAALKALYAQDKAIIREIDGFATTKPPMVSSVGGTLRDVWDTLGSKLDVGRGLGDFDAVYLRVPGTTMKDTARAQAAALIEMLLKFATSPEHGRRIRFIADELSALNDGNADIGVIEVLERARKFDMSCVLAAQNTKGLAPTVDDALRIMVSASGGALLMRGRGQGEACELFGTMPKSETTRHTLGGRHGDEGSIGISDSFLVSPDELDEFGKGDVVYVNRRTAAFGHVTALDMLDLPQIEQTDATRRAPVPNRGPALKVAPHTTPSDIEPPPDIFDVPPDLDETA
ncbi:hypothetical protein ACTD5D_41160 [Nocardia takedensis]|uniref:hypothetical protein n=1 Tax=Nocardia takedensis TaxID=259390 RepID=UPI003F75FA9E